MIPLKSISVEEKLIKAFDCDYILPDFQNIPPEANAIVIDTSGSSYYSSKIFLNAQYARVNTS